MLHFDRLTADFQRSGIFRRAFRFREIVVLAPQAAPGSPLPRALIDHLIVRGGAAKFVDESRSPVFVEAFGPLDLELYALTTNPDESGDHSITLGLGEGGRMRWSGRQTVEPLKLEGKVELTCPYDIHKGAGAAIRDLAVRPRSGGELAGRDTRSLDRATERERAVEFSEASAHVEDRSFRPNIVVDLTDVALRLENVSNDLKAPIWPSGRSRSKTRAPSSPMRA